MPVSDMETHGDTHKYTEYKNQVLIYLSPCHGKPKNFEAPYETTIACGPVTIVALGLAPASQIPKPASLYSLVKGRERIASKTAGEAEIAYLHLAAFAAVGCTGATHSWSIWENGRLTDSIT